LAGSAGRAPPAHAIVVADLAIRLRVQHGGWRSPGNTRDTAAAYAGARPPALAWRRPARPAFDQPVPPVLGVTRPPATKRPLADAERCGRLAPRPSPDGRCFAVGAGACCAGWLSRPASHRSSNSRSA
jgi:hypothetical protein